MGRIYRDRHTEGTFHGDAAIVFSSIGKREKIALEIKSFRRISEIRDIEEALGQYILYQTLLDRYDPEHQLYLAIPEKIRESVFAEQHI